jgi:hypothetical protein
MLEILGFTIYFFMQICIYKVNLILDDPGIQN